MVQPVLTVEAVDRAVTDGLYDDDTAVEICLLVHIGYYPIDKGPQEISLAELHHTFRTKHLLRRLLI